MPPISFPFLIQLLAWGQALLTKGKPLIDDVIAVFKKHDVASDRAMIEADLAEFTARRLRREREV